MMEFGDNIQKYEVDWNRPLGKGGFATVYKARCINTNIYVAIKMIDKQKMNTLRMAERVKQEVTIHSQLKHPSVLELYTFFEDINYVYLVLELAHKGELRRYMQMYKRTMNEIEAATIMKQVVEGLLYLHSHRIVHRDISLANLLLTEDMKVKIADFGLATIDQPGVKHMTLCGTPNYISPEVASRISHGLEVDVWGLGCLLYTLLVGEPPFDSNEIKTTLDRVVKADFTIPPSVSYEARDLIERTLRKSPNERIRLTDVLSHPFILKANAYSKYNNTLASSDSGMLTMSTNTSQNNSRQLFNKSTIPRSRSEDRFIPLPPMQENPKYSSVNGPCSNYTSFYDSKNIQTSDMMLKSLQNNILLQKVNSMEISDEKENPLVTAGIHPKSNSVTSQSSSNPFSTRPAALSENHSANLRKCDSYNSPGGLLSTPLQTSTPQSVPSQKPVECEKPPLLNTDRLNPTRHKLKNVILSIMESGEVIVEFIKHVTRLREDRVMEVLRISSDGQKIVYYLPNNGQGTPIMDDPPIIPRTGPNSVYNYDNLPEKYWKRYSYGVKFVAMVRSKTLKITYHSPRCKFQMMESMEDFDSFFYTGIRISKTAMDGVKLYDSTGRVIYKTVEEICSSSQYQDSWEHFNECTDHCLNLESVLTRIETTAACFPIVVGKKPAVKTTVVKEINKNVLPTKSIYEPVTTPVSHLPPTTGRLSNSLQLPANYTQKNVIIRTVKVLGIGRASLYTQGVIEIDYEDASKLSIIPPEQGDGVTYNKYGCMPRHYSKNDVLPDEIRKKLIEFQNIILNQLMSAPIVSNSTAATGTSTIPLQRSSSMRHFR